MSCFPYPRDTDVEAIRVPLIARIKYSITGQTDFSDFFKRALDGSHSLASAIQSWLFFGLASEALGRNIRHEEFAGADLDGPHPSIDLRIPEWY